MSLLNMRVLTNIKNGIIRQSVRRTLSLKNQQSTLSRSAEKPSSRCLQSLSVQTHVASKRPAFLPEEHSKLFLDSFPDVIEDLLDFGTDPQSAELSAYYRNAFNYLLKSGKKIRASASIIVYRALEKPENLTEENLKLSHYMGWIMELIHGMACMLDDILDRSEKRRGVLCWHEREHVGIKAMNDGELIKSAAYCLHDKFFKNHPCYKPTLDLVHDALWKAIVGESFDMLQSKYGKPRYELFTLDRYYYLIDNKTSFYSFTLPVKFAVYLANYYDPQMHSKIDEICMLLGRFFQIQDDYIDCFSDPAITGKNGDDIKDGKCTWFAVKTLERANSAQREIFEQYYGRPGPEPQRKVFELYKELNLKQVYQDSNNNLRSVILGKLGRLNHTELQDALLKLVQVLDGRIC